MIRTINGTAIRTSDSAITIPRAGTGITALAIRTTTAGHIMEVCTVILVTTATEMVGTPTATDLRADTIPTDTTPAIPSSSTEVPLVTQHCQVEQVRPGTRVIAAVVAPRGLAGTLEPMEALPAQAAAQ